MKRLMLLSVALFLVLPSFSSAAAEDSDKNCKIVERDGPPPSRSHGLSTSVTAGDGKVTAHTSGPNGVSVDSGNGSVTSSVTTGSSGSGSHSQTVTTNSDGSCTIYRYREK